MKPSGGSCDIGQYRRCSHQEGCITAGVIMTFKSVSSLLVLFPTFLAYLFED